MATAPSSGTFDGKPNWLDRYKAFSPEHLTFLGTPDTGL